MKSHDEDPFFDGLVRRCIVPKGFRPQSDAEIAAMLDALGAYDLDDAKRDRMLRKIQGKEPMCWDVSSSDRTGLCNDMASTQQLVEMFRSRGEEIPPEIQEQLRKLEEEAGREAAEGENGNVE
jgi:hypothetical protein